ncbi:hypothetical protein SAY86_025953 [Trapa natans]|uniref:Uncharacterized protein n=1 Tax=Trapa natans TaxID=22666 RepID=A0AAN7KA08_TRANT|nr:hypothetical protein SAY86_025953 [Trapa natans]
MEGPEEEEKEMVKANQEYPTLVLELNANLYGSHWMEALFLVCKALANNEEGTTVRSRCFFRGNNGVLPRKLTRDALNYCFDCMVGYTKLGFFVIYWDAFIDLLLVRLSCF